MPTARSEGQHVLLSKLSNNMQCGILVLWRSDAETKKTVTRGMCRSVHITVQWKRLRWQETLKHTSASFLKLRAVLSRLQRFQQSAPEAAGDGPQSRNGRHQARGHSVILLRRPLGAVRQALPCSIANTADSSRALTYGARKPYTYCKGVIFALLILSLSGVQTTCS